MAKSVLGKGLSALIPERNTASSEENETENVAYLKTVDINDNALQPRTHYDEGKLAELVSSIKEKGILQPILVRDVDGEYQVIAGERRLRAARMAGLDTVPVVIKQVSNQDALVIALVENIQREELNAIEEAEAFSRLVEEFGFNQDVIAQSVGKDRSTISNTLRLLKLPDSIQQSVSDGVISMGHARALLGIDDQSLQLSCFQKIIDKGLSVRETENLVKANLGGFSRRKSEKVKNRDHEIVMLEEELQRKLGTKVRIQAQKKRGKIIIDYYSAEELDRLLTLLRK